VQTLKTAAIVVLLMTIIYSAYVSLTTPPEPLPPEVENMLVMAEEGEFSIDAGLPESLGALSINSGAASTNFEAESSIAGPTLGLSVASDESLGSSGPAASWIPEATDGTAVTGTLSDDVASLSGGAAAEARGDLQASYPTTGQSFSMPDPQGLGSNFQTVSSVTPSSDSGVPPISEDPSMGQSDAARSSSTEPNVGLSNAIRTADRQYGEEKLKEALATLSLFYNAPNLPAGQRSELLSRLDPLARDVIYSKRHLLEQPYRVGQNETLMDVAARYEVPWQLLANINQIDDPVTVLPGTELKVVRGPFRADVDLEQKELTLFLGDLYAGRFPVAVGADPTPKPGTFTVQDKQQSRTFYDASGSPVPPGSPENPYGSVWMDLGGQLCIHGSPSTTSANEKGCISLAADYADDLYGILSQGSSVTIRR
jgi:lipoprotein-anchoring transpeptidase ErfK/SrfK